MSISGSGWPRRTRKWSGMPFRPMRSRRWCRDWSCCALRAPSRCSRWRHTGFDRSRRRSPVDGTADLADIEIAADGGRGSSAPRGAPIRAPPRPRDDVAALSRTCESERADGAGAEPAICGTALREPRTTRVSRAHRHDARSGDADRSGLRGDCRAAQAAFFQRRPWRSHRPLRRRAQSDPGCAGRRAAPARAHRAAPHRVFAGELLEREKRIAPAIALGAVARLLEELAAAGVEQVVVVCADSDRSAPHRLEQADRVARARAWQSTLRRPKRRRCAMPSRCTRQRFKGVFLIQPATTRSGLSISRARTTSDRIGIRAWAS